MNPLLNQGDLVNELSSLVCSLRSAFCSACRCERRIPILDRGPVCWGRLDTSLEVGMLHRACGGVFCVQRALSIVNCGPAFVQPGQGFVATAAIETPGIVDVICLSRLLMLAFDMPCLLHIQEVMVVTAKVLTLRWQHADEGLCACVMSAGCNRCEWQAAQGPDQEDCHRSAHQTPEDGG